MNTTLYLIRHGLPEYPVNDAMQKLMYGPEVPLSAKGIADAQALTHTLPKFDAIYTSPFLRARQTAEIIAKKVGVKTVIEDTTFRDLVYNNATGMLLDLVLQKKAPPHPDDETEQEVYARIVNGIERILSERPGQTVGIVFHGHPIRFAVWKYVEGKTALPENVDALVQYNYPLQAEAWVITWNSQHKVIHSQLITRQDNMHPGVGKW